MTDDRSAAGSSERTVPAMKNHEANGNGWADGRQRWALGAAPRWEALVPELELGPDEMDLYCDQYSEPYATIRAPDGRRTFRVKGEAFRDWMICRYVDRGIRCGLGRIRDDIAMMAAL